MAYSSLNAGDNDGDESVFSSGGAIMDALNGKDPSKDADKKPAAKGKAPLKKKAPATKSQKAKAAPKKQKNDDENLDLSQDTTSNKEEKEISNTKRNGFIDGVLNANLQENGYASKKKRKLNSYE